MSRSPQPMQGSIPACAGEPAPFQGSVPMPTVYPRVCGGTVQIPVLINHAGGLSPRVRGNLPGAARRCWRLGSIPACAGEPRAPPGVDAVTAVYPRVCGGTATGGGRVAQSAGLSPRVRGNPPSRSCNTARSRSIPACAGEPGTTPAPHPQRKVYPRVCGGTRTASSSSHFPRGLSPRVRGNRSIRTIPDPCRGSIPACAGEPAIRLSTAGIASVYPRVCGGT